MRMGSESGRGPCLSYGDRGLRKASEAVTYLARAGPGAA